MTSKTSASDHWDTPTLMLGLIGRGVTASRTPRMHMDEAAAQGLRCDYRLFDMDDQAWSHHSLPTLLDELEQRGYHGLNITSPFKREVLDQLDHLSWEAEAVGAVNTVIFSDGQRSGYNTDKLGFAESFTQLVPHVPHSSVLLLGAGGAGVAVAHALAGLCDVQSLYILDKDEQLAKVLAERIRSRWTIEATAIRDAMELMRRRRVDGVVNATPMGMARYPGMALPAACLAPPLWVNDIVYFPLETELLATARELGCRVVSGEGMAVQQAALAFKLFSGRPANVHRMRASFKGFDHGSRTSAPE